MPKIVEEQSFDGAENLIARLGLDELLEEVRTIITGFQLNIQEEKDSNSAGIIRSMIDVRFVAAGGWIQRKSGGVDWMKRQEINGRPRFISVDVEVQVSGRSDLVAVDLIHLRKQLLQGEIDLAVLVVPSDRLGKFITDRVATVSQTKRHIDMGRFEDMPFILMGIEHDGPGAAIRKKRYSYKKAKRSRTQPDHETS
jgi:hypothetical protein